MIGTVCCSQLIIWQKYSLAHGLCSVGGMEGEALLPEACTFARGLLSHPEQPAPYLWILALSSTARAAGIMGPGVDLLFQCFLLFSDDIFFFS